MNDNEWINDDDIYDVNECDYMMIYIINDDDDE